MTAFVSVLLTSQCSKCEVSHSRVQKLTMLCQVMGVENVYDPDPTYELTLDNMMKILAIHMRFRYAISIYER